MDAITQAVKVLNEAIEEDHDAILALYNNKVPLNNDNMYYHDSIIISANNTLGMFGLINGLFGYDRERKSGYIGIEAEMNEEKTKVIKINKFIDLREKWDDAK